MSTITREQQRQILIDTANHVINRENTSQYSENLRELARIALASLEAEVVAINDYMAFAFHHALSDSSLGADDVEEIKTGLRAAFANVTATPAPVSVPDEQHSERFNWTLGQWAEHVGGHYQGNDPANYYEFGSFMAVSAMLSQFGTVQQKLGWNAYRAAMLQGADGNSPEIPDGWALVPVEPTEDMIVNGFESEPDESFSDAEVWEAYDAMSGCQQAAHRAKLCWAAMIAAAPKPEA